MSYDGYFKYDARVATNYDCDREHEEHWIAERDFVVSAASSHRFGRVLDVPVGTGRLFEHMREAEEIVGVDVSADMLAVAAHRPSPALHSRPILVRADALSLPFADRRFDTVICFRLAHLLPPELIPRLFSELARVCRGRILLQVYIASEQRDVRAGVIRRAIRAVRILGLGRRTPWSHICSYAHPRTLFEQSAMVAGLSITRGTKLAEYKGSSVEVLELAPPGEE